MARRFMLVSIGILCLMLAALIGFHIGNGSVRAQAPEGGPIVGFVWEGAVHHVILANGDMYSNSANLRGPAEFIGNIWTGQDK